MLLYSSVMAEQAGNQFKPVTFEIGEYSIINQISFSTDSNEDIFIQAMCWIEIWTSHTLLDTF
jgi:hypothetical protein